MNELLALPSSRGGTSASASAAVLVPGDAPEPLERLEARICELAGHLTAATCKFLLLVADFDERKGWLAWEMPSCAAWLSWKCQIAPGTAREQVRVARCLVDNRLIRQEFAAGRLSYAKVRALTRIVTPETEADLVEMATPMTAGQLERFAHAHRRVSETDRGRPRPARKLTWGPAGDLDYQFRAILPAEAATDPEPDDVSAETPVRQPQAAKPVPPDMPFWHPAHEDRCHLDDGPAITPGTLALIGCSATISTMFHDLSGAIIDVGHRTRKVPPALRRALRERDRGRCQYPGCDSRRTDAHHIRYWANGGRTNLANLISLCGRHHHLVHDKGHIITATGTGSAFYTKDGMLIPGCPQLPQGPGGITTAHDAAITPTTIIPPHSGERLNLSLAIWIAFANARTRATRGHS
jgi:hypothetical protein